MTNDNAQEPNGVIDPMRPEVTKITEAVIGQYEESSPQIIFDLLTVIMVVSRFSGFWPTGDFTGAFEVAKDDIDRYCTAVEEDLEKKSES